MRAKTTALIYRNSIPVEVAYVMHEHKYLKGELFSPKEMTRQKDRLISDLEILASNGLGETSLGNKFGLTKEEISVIMNLIKMVKGSDWETKEAFDKFSKVYYDSLRKLEPNSWDKERLYKSAWSTSW